MAEEMTLEKLERLLQQACSREISYDPTNWSPKNRCWGCCGVIALVVQDYFGGVILHASLSGVRGFEHMRHHYWNRVKNGSEQDLSKRQFGSHYPRGLRSKVVSRQKMLAYPETKRRYDLLIERLQRLMAR